MEKMFNPFVMYVVLLFKQLHYIVSECSKLAQKENKQVRHNNVAKMLYWKLCEKWDSIKQRNGIQYTQARKSFRI